MSLIRSLCPALCCFAFFFSAARAEAETGLLFSADFERSLQAEQATGEAAPLYARRASRVEDGRWGAAARVPRGGELVYAGLGNVHVAAGTLSFFWQMPVLAETALTIADLAPLERLNYGRFLRLSYNHAMPELYFTPPDVGGSFSRSAVALSVPQMQHQMQAGRWYHLVIAWDQSRGAALYIDGQKRAGYEQPWFFAGSITRLGLGMTGGADRPGASVHEQYFDRVQLFDSWLSDAAIADLAAGRMPESASSARTGWLDQRMERHAWQPDALDDLPLVGDEGLGLRQVGIASSRDVRRRNWHLFDGQRGQRWPGMVAYTDGGRQLDLKLRSHERYDVVQLLGRGPLALGLPSGQPMLDFARPLLVVSDSQLRWHHQVLSQPVEHTELLLRRGGGSSFEQDHVVYPTVPAVERPEGVAFELNLFERIAWTPLREAAGWQRLGLHRPAVQPEGADAVLLRGVHHPLDQTLLMAEEEPTSAPDAKQAEKKFLAWAPLRLLHIWGPGALERRGLAAVAVELSFRPEGSSLKGAMCLEAWDPISRERRAATVNVRWERAAPDQPVQVRLLLDLQDQVLPVGHRPWLTLSFDREIHLDLSASSAAFQWAPVAEALFEHRAEQLARFSDLFQELSEGRPWGWRSWRVQFLKRVITELRELDPEDSLIRAYWHWIHPQEAPPVVQLPELPAGVPSWAGHVDGAIETLKRVPYWWIDHRETPQGEFGANDGINDDTDLVQDWWALHLMRGPDAKLFESLKRVADRSWIFTMKDGLNWPTTDALHAYEWGVNAQTHMALMDYGNPVYLARLMAIARECAHLMQRDEEGAWRFRSWYYGSQYVDETRHGEDRPVNGLMLQPAMLLAWYNGHPQLQEMLTGWTEAMMAQPIPQAGLASAVLTSAAHASYDLSGDRRFLDFLNTLPPDHVGRYRFTDDLDEAAGQLFAQAAVREDLWSRSLHNSNYRDLDRLFLAWRGTGDIAPLLEGLKLTRNALAWSLPMLSEAEQSTDRVWLPQRLVNRMVLGGPAMVRNELYPKHAVSWERATGRVAPWVLEQSRQGLIVQLANLEDQAVSVDMRLWRLDHGRYEIFSEEAVGFAEAGQMQAERPGARAVEKRQAVLQRYDALTIQLPPRSVRRVALRQLEALGDHRHRPDLAIAADDAFFNRDRSALSFQVHNVGARSSGPFRLRVRVGETVLLDRQMASLEAPLDLRPRHVGVKVWNLKPFERKRLVIEIDPDASIQEITRVNNRLELVPVSRPGHDSQR